MVAPQDDDDRHEHHHAHEQKDATGPWGVLSRFLEKYGLPAGLLLLVAFLVWANEEDRRASRMQIELQLKDLNGQLYHIGSALTTHSHEGEQLLQTVRALCINAATSNEDRNRCLGR